MRKSMIRLSQVKVPIRHTKETVIQTVAKQLRVTPSDIASVQYKKRSIDARKKEEICYIYAVDVTLQNPKKETTLVKRASTPNIQLAKPEGYSFTSCGEQPLRHRPIIIGAGPAGLFAAYFLAQEGYAPLLIERGAPVEDRVKEVERFWNTGILNPETNVQFGEGGAGTFSDGKLNTMVKEQSGRIHKTLEIFVKHGAPEEILYVNKPHIGTDCLRNVVTSMRQEIIKMGGDIRFHTKLTDFQTEKGSLTAIEVNHNEWIPCEALVLAIGHSARDTFAMLDKKQLYMTPKAFAVGVRIEHEQAFINQTQYGTTATLLPPADYKITHQCANQRGIYSFCMCPGGFVVNASSEEGHLVVNGMSNQDRAERNANSALIVTVTPDDYRTEKKSVLDGVEFQRKLEKAAYTCGKGQVPIQLFGDLLNNRPSVTIGHITPNIKGAYTFANLQDCLPTFIVDSLKEGILAFDKKMKGFADEEAVLAGVETRTSSPLRMERNAAYESSIAGIYPCGEGAGYAGGITSAAVDGIRVFEKIAEKYSNRSAFTLY